MIALKVDATDEIEVKQMFDQVVKKYGRLDALVNNSGITDYFEQM